MPTKPASPPPPATSGTPQQPQGSPPPPASCLPPPLPLFPATGLDRGDPAQSFAALEAQRIASLAQAAAAANFTALQQTLRNFSTRPEAPRGCTYGVTGSNYTLYAALAADTGGHPVQGLQDNWLLSPFAGVAPQRNITSMLFVAQASPRLIGANYTFGNATLTVVVDDQLPFAADGTLCGAVPTVNAQGVASVWGAFAEKTYARLADVIPAFRTQQNNTGYRGLRSGSPALALSALTSPGTLQHQDCRNLGGEALAQMLARPTATDATPRVMLLSTLGQAGFTLLPNYTDVYAPVDVGGRVQVSESDRQLWHLDNAHNSTNLAISQVYTVLRDDPVHNATQAVLQSPWGYAPVISDDGEAVQGAAAFAIDYERLAAVCDALVQR